MKRKYIIGIGVLVILLCLSLVMCSLFDGTYEGEKVPIETTEDVFDDGEEDYISQNDKNDNNSDESNISKNNHDESKKDESAHDEISVEGNNTNTNNEDVNDTKNEQENDDNHIDEGWGPFY